MASLKISFSEREIAEKTSELEGKAKYAEGQVEQLKTQVSHADEDFGKMRIELDEEKGKSIETVVRLEDDCDNPKLTHLEG